MINNEENEVELDYTSLFKKVSPLTTLSGLFIMTASVLFLVAEKEDVNLINSYQLFLSAGIIGILSSFIYFLKEMAKDGIFEEFTDTLFSTVLATGVVLALVALYLLSFSNMFSGMGQILKIVSSFIVGMYIPLILYKYVHKYKYEYIKFLEVNSLWRWGLLLGMTLSGAVLVLWYSKNYNRLFDIDLIWFFLGLYLGCVKTAIEVSNLRPPKKKPKKFEKQQFLYDY